VGGGDTEVEMREVEMREVEMWEVEMWEVEMREVEMQGLQAERPFVVVRHERFRSLWREEVVG